MRFQNYRKESFEIRLSEIRAGYYKREPVGGESRWLLQALS